LATRPLVVDANLRPWPGSTLSPLRNFMNLLSTQGFGLRGAHPWTEFFRPCTGLSHLLFLFDYILPWLFGLPWVFPFLRQSAYGIHFGGAPRSFRRV